jgi:hypothetical protein
VAAFVEQVVVAPADQRHVVEIGAAAVRPVRDVVRLAPRRVDGAAGRDAAAIADLKGATEPGWRGSLRASDVEHLTTLLVQPSPERVGRVAAVHAVAVGVGR